MINFLQKAIEDLGIARYAIDQLLKMDIEQTRMRYCFTEYKDVIDPSKNGADEQEYKNLMKSCIGTSIVIQSLVKQLSDDTEVYKGKTVAVDFKYHPRFGIVKIVAAKSRSSK